MECGKSFSVEEFVEEMDDKTWDQISHRPCDRV
jgi:hypothetical protein